MNYYILAGTGGANNEHVPHTKKGDMDHFAWVTITDQGPRVANILLPGVLADDVVVEEDVREYLDSWSQWMEQRAREQGLYQPPIAIE